MAYIVTVVEVEEVEVIETDTRYQKIATEHIPAEEYAMLSHEERRAWKMDNASEVPRAEAQYTREVYGYPPPTKKKVEKKRQVFEQQVSFLNMAKVICAVNGLKVSE